MALGLCDIFFQERLIDKPNKKTNNETYKRYINQSKKKL